MILMINLIIITISLKEILETRNSFKICKIGRYLDKIRDREVEARVSLGEKEERKHIWRLTNLIANS